MLRDRSLLLIAAGVLFWWLIALVAKSPLFPSPLAVGRAIISSVREGTLFPAVTTTVLRLAIGYVIALVVGVPLGVGFAKVGWLGASLGRLSVGIGSVPSICWLPISILWFGLSEAAIQSVVIGGALFPIAIGTERAVRNTVPQLERAGRTLGARGLRLLLTITLPAALPGIVAGAKLGFTFALRALLAAELLFVSGGLGQLLETGRDVADTALVFAVMVVLVIVGRATEWLVFSRVEREVARRWGTT